MSSDESIVRNERAQVGDSLPWPQVLASLKLNSDGLIPAIAQQHDTGEVLMMAWMNREALTETLATGRVCFWSRSRQALWRKGESSGQVQHLIEARLDCDGDTLLLSVEQRGGIACHTGREHCFYRKLIDGEWQTVEPVLKDPEEIYATKR